MEGELGLGTSDSNVHSTFTQVTTDINNDVEQISCGYTHTFILKNDGSVWSCGNNMEGELGLGDTTNRTSFTQVTINITLSDYELNRQKLYYYLLDNSIEVTEDMDIGTMLDLLVDDYINNMILGYENNLRIILTDEGVSVSDEDNMDSLITKVDEEFNDKENEISTLETELSGKVTPVGTAVVSNVLTGKTFINSTGSTLTGTMANNGTKTITPSASTQTLGAGYYDKITINGDSDLIAANIVTGKNIFGVNGSAGSNHYSMFSLSQTQISGYTIGDVFEIVGNTTNVKQITLSYGSTLQYSPSRVIINIPTIYSRIQDAYPYYNVIIDSYAAFGANNFVYLSHPGGLNPMYYDLKIYITDISKTGCVLNFATNGKYSNDLIMPDTFHISVIG